MVPLLVIMTVVIFIIVDLLLRFILQTAQKARIKKARKEALEVSLRLDYSEEAPSLKRVEVDNPKAVILAVDDEEIVLGSFRKILVLDGYSIDTVERGKEALGLIRKKDYDFVFVDLKMPEMDGVEVTKAVKHLRPDIDVIVITGYASVESAVETMKYGAMDYVQKPFTEDELVDFVNKSLIRRQDRIERETKPQIHLITPSAGVTKAKHKINVPSGIFIAPSHTWVNLELNGIVQIGIDDFAQKILSPIKNIDLPKEGKKLEKGDPLFSIEQGDQRLVFPAPVSGKVIGTNADLMEHIDYLRLRPYDLGWICAMEPSKLPMDLGALIIGADSISWYQKEVDKFSAKLSEIIQKLPAKPSKKEKAAASWQAFSLVFFQSKGEKQ